MTPADFDRLLKWLDEDETRAAEKYKSLHRRLARMFLARGAFAAEDLADQTFDRVTRRLPEIIDGYEGDPAPYIFATARNIYFEFVKKPKPEPLPELSVASETEASENIYQTCLKECLEKLPPEQKKLFIDYFLFENEKKSEYHEEMSQKLGITLNYLRTKIYRVRMKLEECVRECARQKSL